MDKIIKLVVLLVVLYVAYSVGLPWVKGLLGDSPARLGSPDSDAGEEALCARAAESAVDRFGDRLRRYTSPPIDADAWYETVSITQDEVYEAERGCRCGHPACREAAQALAKLGDMVTDFDDSVQSRGALPANGARRLESIYDSVHRARALAR